MVSSFTLPSNLITFREAHNIAETHEVFMANSLRSSGRRRRKTAHLPPTILSDDDLREHLAALVTVDERFGKLHEVTGEVSVRWLEPGFKGLFKVITGQQISAAAGQAIFTRCEAIPDAMMPERLTDVGDDTLRTAGLSLTKVRTLRAAAEAICQGALDLTGLVAVEPEDAVEQLSAVKGIGRWTAEVYLLFAAGHPDIFPAGDLALREAARQGLALGERPTERALTEMALAWRPHRSAAARLLWAYYAAVKNGRDATPAS
jgi:DNA-3-methyladenine glycosylase II